MGNVINIASGKQRLIKDVAVDLISPFNSGYWDVEQLVQEHDARRSDLRCIEDFDDEVQQCASTRLAKLMGIDWRLEGGNVGSMKIASAKLKACYPALLTGSWRSLLYGYSVMELMWERDGNNYWPVASIEKPFEWFNVDQLGNLYYKRRGGTALLGEPVDQQLKFILTRNEATYTRPRGRALLAVLFWPSFYRLASWKFWMQFLERTGQPMLVGKGADPAQMASQLRAALMDAVIAVPIEGDVSTVGGTSKGEAFAKAEEALIKRIQKVILGQTLTSDTGSNGNGSKALGDIHNEVRSDKTVADIALIQPAMQQFINAIYAINFPGQTVPLVIYSVEKGLETGRASRDAMLINTGTVELSKEYYEREYGFKPGDINVIPSAAKTANEPLPSDQNKQKQPPAPNNSNNKSGAN